MGYVLVRTDNGKFVAPRGSTHSYTRDLTRARIYPTRESAERDACGNERAASVDSLLYRQA